MVLTSHPTPPHKPKCRTIYKEYLLNTGRKPETSQKPKKRTTKQGKKKTKKTTQKTKTKTYKKKKKGKETRNQLGLALQRGICEREKEPTL